MEVEFAEFEDCERCDSITDMVCVCCDKLFCLGHMEDCVQCQQSVCEECYEEDLCCLVRPWGEKAEKRLKMFYENKFVDMYGMRCMSEQSIGKGYGKEHRMEAIKRSITRFVDKFDAFSFIYCKAALVRDFFPRITKYVETEKLRVKFVAFMKQLSMDHPSAFYLAFSNDDLREELLSVMDQLIRSDFNGTRSQLIVDSMQSKELFKSLRNRGLLDWNLVGARQQCIITHIDALKWIEQNGIDVACNDQHLKQFVMDSPAEILEYLMVEKGMTIGFMFRFGLDTLKMLFRLKGMKGMQGIDPAQIRYDFESVKFLKSIGYEFDKRVINSRDVFCMYVFAACKILKYEDLSEDQKEEFDDYICFNDIKACKHLYPFMKEIRKKKIMAVILCIRKTCKLQKEIIWNILDLAYSPINERGSI